MQQDRASHFAELTERFRELAARFAVIERPDSTPGSRLCLRITQSRQGTGTAPRLIQWFPGDHPRLRDFLAACEHAGRLLEHVGRLLEPNESPVEWIDYVTQGEQKPRMVNRSVPGIADIYDYPNVANACVRTSTRLADRFAEAALKAESEPAEPKPAAEPDDAPKAADADDYVLVSELWLQRPEYKRASDVTRFLDKLPDEPAPAGIRRYRRGQRRFVHEGDWHRWHREKDRRESEALDDEALQEKLADIESRKAAERRRRRK